MQENKASKRTEGQIKRKGNDSELIGISNVLQDIAYIRINLIHPCTATDDKKHNFFNSPTQHLTLS